MKMCEVSMWQSQSLSSGLTQESSLRDRNPPPGPVGADLCSFTVKWSLFICPALPIFLRGLDS